MPSIEIVCVGQVQPVGFSDLPFAVAAEAELISHRPSPLFKTELFALKGCIYHLGNPECDDPGYEGFFFAYDLLSEVSRTRRRGRFLQIAEEFLPALKQMIDVLLDSSPSGQVFFYSDWQFGPVRKSRGGVASDISFWSLHDARQLKLNACYLITREDAQHHAVTL